MDLAAGLDPTPVNLQRVAREADEAAARWAFGQWALRERAKGRFPHAERMLFVREALEQATHAELAAYHASIFPDGALVADLTCGIGGDLLALAARGPVIGFELDSERAEYARWNLQALGLSGEVREEDGLAWLRSHEAPYVLVDPARRVEGRRTLDPHDFAPNPFEVAEAAAKCVRWAMKLSPMMPDDILGRLAPRIEFVSFGGECREALLIGGTAPLSSPEGSAEGGDAKTSGSPLSSGGEGLGVRGQRSYDGVWAVHPDRTPLQGDVAVSAVAERAEGWLHDADPAAVRAHALGGFGLASLGDSPGYLVGDRVDSPWLRPYEVLDDVAPKRLKATLKALGSATPILKQRGARQDLDRWRKELGSHGDRPIAVAFYVRGSSVRAAVLSL